MANMKKKYKQHFIYIRNVLKEEYFFPPDLSDLSFCILKIVIPVYLLRPLLSLFLFQESGW